MILRILSRTAAISATVFLEGLNMANAIGVIFTPHGEYFFHDDFSWTTNGTDETSVAVLEDIDRFMRLSVITATWDGDPLPSAFYQVLDRIKLQVSSAYGTIDPPPVVNFHSDSDVVY